jgi:hypothetical protein
VLTVGTPLLTDADALPRLAPSNASFCGSIFGKHFFSTVPGTCPAGQAVEGTYGVAFCEVLPSATELAARASKKAGNCLFVFIAE